MKKPPIRVNNIKTAIVNPDKACFHSPEERTVDWPYTGYGNLGKIHKATNVIAITPSTHSIARNIPRLESSPIMPLVTKIIPAKDTAAVTAIAMAKAIY